MADPSCADRIVVAVMEVTEAVRLPLPSVLPFGTDIVPPYSSCAPAWLYNAFHQRLTHLAPCRSRKALPARSSTRPTRSTRSSSMATTSTRAALRRPDGASLADRLHFSSRSKSKRELVGRGEGRSRTTGKRDIHQTKETWFQASKTTERNASSEADRREAALFGEERSERQRRKT